jgi:hypothetical protein
LEEEKGKEKNKREENSEKHNLDLKGVIFSFDGNKNLNSLNFKPPCDYISDDNVFIFFFISFFFFYFLFVEINF